MDYVYVYYNNKQNTLLPAGPATPWSPGIPYQEIKHTCNWDDCYSTVCCMLEAPRCTVDSDTVLQNEYRHFICWDKCKHAKYVLFFLCWDYVHFGLSLSFYGYLTLSPGLPVSPTVPAGPGRPYKILRRRSVTDKWSNTCTKKLRINTNFLYATMGAYTRYWSRIGL